MYVRQRTDETCVDVWQRINKRNAQGIRSVSRALDTFDMVDALKGSLNLEHVHWMIKVDTYSVTLRELEDKVLTMGKHVDQFMSKNSAISSLPSTATTLRSVPRLLSGFFFPKSPRRTGSLPYVCPDAVVGPVPRQAGPRYTVADSREGSDVTV
jgi:hypothetical protein